MDKVALITGAARGIGKQIAITLAKEGYNIALNYRTNTDSIIELKEKIESYNVECLLVQGDVSIYEDTERIAKETFEKFGKIDVLVNNAGITKDMLLIRMKPEDFMSVVNVNLTGTYNMTKNVSNYMMKARSGRIIKASALYLFVSMVLGGIMTATFSIINRTNSHRFSISSIERSFLT